MKQRFLTFLLVLVAACVGTPAPAFAAPPTVHAASALPAVAPCSTFVDAMSIDTMAVRTISAASAYHLAPADSSRTTAPLGVSLTFLVGLGFIGAVKTVSADKDSNPSRDTVRQQLNQIIQDLYYVLLHRPAWQVAAAAVAPPLCATATTTSQVKTTATSQLWINGVVKSLTATDNLWTLTGGNLAAGFFRRYLLCWDGTSATTVVSVIASTDAATAALCAWPTRPPAGTVIVGILTIANTTNAFIPGTTLLGATGVTATYIDGIDDSVILAATVTP